MTRRAHNLEDSGGGAHKVVDGGFAAAVLGVALVRIQTGSTGCDDNVSSRRGVSIFTHKVDGQLGAVIDALDVDVGAAEVRFGRDRGRVSMLQNVKRAVCQRVGGKNNTDYVGR